MSENAVLWLKHWSKYVIVHLRMRMWELTMTIRRKIIHVEGTSNIKGPRSLCEVCDGH